MYLKKIALLNFKNIEQEELTFCPGINLSLIHISEPTRP